MSKFTTSDLTVLLWISLALIIFLFIDGNSKSNKLNTVCLKTEDFFTALETSSILDVDELLENFEKYEMLVEKHRDYLSDAKIIDGEYKLSDQQETALTFLGMNRSFRELQSLCNSYQNVNLLTFFEESEILRKKVIANE